MRQAVQRLRRGTVFGTHSSGQIHFDVCVRSGVAKRCFSNLWQRCTPKIGMDDDPRGVEHWTQAIRARRSEYACYLCAHILRGDLSTLSAANHAFN